MQGKGAAWLAPVACVINLKHGSGFVTTDTWRFRGLPPVTGTALPILTSFLVHVLTLGLKLLGFAFPPSYFISASFCSMINPLVLLIIIVRHAV